MLEYFSMMYLTIRQALEINLSLECSRFNGHLNKGTMSSGGVMSKYQTFSKEFKIEAVRLLEQGDKSASELALSLGIRRNQLYKWQEQLRGKGDAAFRGKGRLPADQESEIVRLRRELARVTEERDILKKAAAYFAQDVK
jgi:transposase